MSRPPAHARWPIDTFESAANSLTGAVRSGELKDDECAIVSEYRARFNLSTIFCIFFIIIVVHAQGQHIRVAWSRYIVWKCDSNLAHARTQTHFPNMMK